MNFLFICKRYYTNKDVIRHRFGRLYELPTQLARLGHRVTVLCLDYRNNDSQESFIEQFGDGSVRWIVVPLPRFFRFNFLKIYRELKHEHPDVVLGSSDIPCLWLTRKLSERLKTPYVVDLYDNYESFGQARIPGFRRVLKMCVKSAAAVITVSATLKEKVIADYMPLGLVVVMNNGVAHRSFFIGDKALARESLNLPVDMKLIGTAGNLSRMKGLDTVYEAWAQIEKQTDKVCLVLAGRIENGFPIPTGIRVIYLGELLEEQVGQLFRSLDVGIIPAHDSEFGRYCFPQKLYEMVACDLPVVAAKVGAIADILQSHSKILYEPEHAESLVKALALQFKQPQLTGLKTVGWNELVAGVEPVFLTLMQQE